MPERDDRLSRGRTMPAPERTGHPLRSLLSDRRTPTAVIGFAIIVAVGLAAPGASPGPWAWIRVGLAWFLAAVALMTIAGARQTHRAGTLPTVPTAWAGMIVTVLVSLTFSVRTAILAVLILANSMLALAQPSDRPARQSAIWALAVVLAPLWVWSAFDAWDRWLLLLLPFAAIGLISLEHAARSRRAPGAHESRLAAWIGVVGLALTLQLASLLSAVDSTWVTAGLAGVACFAATDLGTIRTPRTPLPPVALPGLALAWLWWSWLVAL